MKKAMTIGMVAVLVAGAAIAQDDVVMVGQMEGSSTSEAQVSVEAALMSAYVWRGQVYNNDMVLQPQFTISQQGVSFNIWGNYDLGENANGTSSDFSEIDVSLAYTLPLDINEMAIDIGVISYNFPANGDISSKSTAELFATVTALSWQDYFIPSVTLFGDIDEANGTYILFDVVAPYQVSDYLAVEAGVSAGWGNTSYNDYYWAPGTDSKWNDYNFYGNASYEIMENLTASVNVTYTLLEGGSIRDGANANSAYENDKKFWGGASIAYDF